VSLDLRNCDCMEMLYTIPEKSQHLIIVDPPYFEVKGKFDFVWPTFEAYLSDVRRWATGIKRVMADNGTLLWWGHAKKIAYSQVVLDEFFSLENSLVWKKTDGQAQKQEFDAARCFAPVTERLLMYSQGNEPGERDKTGIQVIYSNPDCFSSIKSYMRSERDALMSRLGIKTITGFNDFIDELTGTKSVVSHHYFADSQYSFPTKQHYTKMQTTGFWRREYEDLRREYEDLRRPFNNAMKLLDVLEFSQEAHLTGRWDHPTQKPPTLCRALIQTCSKRGQNLLVPFAGSFTEVVEGINLGLNVTASELDPTYYARGLERVEQQTAQLSLL
jgi:DNA modification methylase